MTEPPRSQSQLTWLGLGTGALRAISLGGKLVLLVFMGRAFAIDALGIWGIFTATAGLLVSLIGLEYHQHSLRALVQARANGALPSSIVLSQVRLIGLVYAFAPVVAVPMFLASGLPAWCAWYLALTVMALHVSLECQRILIALERPLSAYVVNTVANGLWILPVVMIAWRKPTWFTLRFVLAAWAAAALVAALLGVVKLARTDVFRGGSLSHAAIDWAGVRTGLSFLASALCLLAIDTIDRYALEWLRTTTEVGVYTFHASIARAHRDLLFVVGVAPVVPQLIGNGHRAGMEQHSAVGLSHARRIVVVSALLGAALVIAMQLVPLVTERPELAAHASSFYWLISGNVALGLSTFAHYALYAARRERTLLHAHIAGLAVATLASAALVPRLGVLGAAAANASGLSAIALYKQLAYVRLHRVA